MIVYRENLKGSTKQLEHYMNLVNLRGSTQKLILIFYTFGKQMEIKFKRRILFTIMSVTVSPNPLLGLWLRVPPPPLYKARCQDTQHHSSIY